MHPGVEPAKVRSPAGQGQRATRLVWALTSVALAVGLFAGLVVQHSLENVRNSTQELHTIEQRADASLRELQSCVDDVRKEFDARIAGAQVQATSGSVDALTALAPRLELLLPADRGEDRPGLQIPAVAELLAAADRWRSSSAENEARLSAAEKELDEALQRAHTAIVTAEGNRRLQLALTIRSYRKADPARALEIARELLAGIQASIEHPQLQSEVQDLTILCQELRGERDADRLSSLKDNKLSPTLARLRSAVAATGEHGAQEEFAAADVESIAEALFGRGYRLDNDHQTIVPGNGGLYPARQTYLDVARQHAELVVRSEACFRDLERVRHALEAGVLSTSVRVATSGEDVFHRAAQMLEWIAIAGFALILGLGLLIARAINGQIRGILETNQKLDRAIVEAQRANLAKSEFLANMSHEIRTPMNGIIGMTGFLLEGELPLEKREHANTVRVCAETLLSLINDVLDFSKIEAGKLQLEQIDFELQGVVEDVLDILAARAETRQVELLAFCDPKLPQSVRGDPGRMRQILLNLANNAIKFTEKGEVSIRLEPSRAPEGALGVRLSVRDTGIGIPADRIGALFQAFSQVDGSTTRRFGGTGLGLAISKRLAEAMGGSIGVESEEGVGSTFWCELVFERLPDDARLAREAAAVALRGERVLVVDDNATNRRILDSQLQSWGFRCECVASGAEALASLRQALEAGDPFRAALLDYQMPQQTGLELAAAIRAESALRGLSLLLLTSVSGVLDSKRSKDLGFAGCLTKPVKPRHLRNQLLAILAPLLQAEPIAAAPRALLPQPAVADAALPPGLRVLLAEDNAVNQKVALMMLQRLGCVAEAVLDGKQAVAAYSPGRYDLLILDCQMPELDGYEAARAIRAAEQSIGAVRVPILALTANAMQGDRERCLAAGMDEYITKPVRLPDLARALGQLLAAC
jgi:signal transduction histidine kinase/DNA-binding response OmpR family regulator